VVITTINIAIKEMTPNKTNMGWCGAVKGFNKYMDFVSTFRTSSDWKADFRNTYGISSDEFYLKLAPYLRARLN
jgi:hypothetical protein